MLLGIDIGYSNLKVVLGPAGAAEPHCLLRPSGAAPVDGLVLPERIRGESDDLQVLVDGVMYVAAVSPDRLQGWNRELHADYQHTGSYRALFYAALRLAQRERIEKVVTGLPVALYQDKSRRAALVQMLQGAHAVTTDKTVQVLKAQVIPQPVGAYLDLVCQSENPDTLNDMRILIVDPGFFSVDWVMIVGGEVHQRFSGSSQQATSVLLDEADRLIQEAHGGRLGRERLEHALRQGRAQLPLFGTPLDLTPYFEQAAERTAPQALRALREALRLENADVDVVLVAGGGARFYQAAVESVFPNSKVLLPRQPVFANARGFWQYANLAD